MDNSYPKDLVAYIHSYDRFHIKNFGKPHDLLNSDYLRTLSSHDWRSQDHYRVLRLGHLRRQVTPEQVRLAYRAYVLRWHPDKCGGNDHVFKCMAKASTILSDETKRRSFDSVDPSFDESIPDEIELACGDFFAILAPVFERNAIFSKKWPVLQLGYLHSPREEVEDFYEFWNKFDSWRSFEYQHPAGDGADSDNENRMDKRYKEKQAKAAQKNAKAADNARLGKLIDLAYRHDPRIARFRQEDLQRKQAKKLEREEASRQSKLAEFQAREEAERQNREREEAEKLAKQQEKERKEQEKSKSRQEKRLLKSFFSDHNYFSNGIQELEETALLVEKLLAKLTLASQIEDAREELMHLQDRSSIMSKLNEISERNISSPFPTIEINQGRTCISEGNEEVPEWAAEELELLIQAVKMFPGGVAQRWQRITEHINAHLPTSCSPKSLSHVTKQAERLKESSSGRLVPPASSCQTLPPKRKDPRIDQNEPSINPDKIISSPSTASDVIEDVASQWTREEQAKLEKAMKMIPSTDKERWDKIAKLIPSRSKKQILERVKSIAAALKK